MGDNFNLELWSTKLQNIYNKDKEQDMRLDKVEEQVSFLEKSDIELKAALAASFSQSEQMSKQLYELNKSLVESTKENSKQITDLQKQNILSKSELEKQILEISNQPVQENADKWKSMSGYILAGIISLLFTLIQSGIIGGK